jgi:integrase
VRNKTDLGWRVKTGSERSVPLLPEAAAVLRSVIGSRQAGPVFLREKLAGKLPKLVGKSGELVLICEDRQRLVRTEGRILSRSDVQKIARSVWWDSGAIKADAVRNSFVRVMQALGRSEATCPKSWRHSFATLLQDANVDPLIRQQTMGHRPPTGPTLGMTANYTHTRPETQRQQIEQALRQWPASLQFALEWTARKKEC